MDQTNKPQTIIIRRNGSGEEGSVRYEITPSGFLAIINAQNEQTHMEIITHVPGISDATRIYTERMAPPVLDVQVDANGTFSLPQLSGRFFTPEPDPETPTNHGVPQLTVPATPCALRLARPSIVLNRTVSIGTPCPEYNGPSNFVREDTPSPTVEDNIIVNGGTPVRRMLFPRHALAPMSSFLKEASPVPTEISSPRSELEEPRRAIQPGIDNGYGSLSRPNSTFGGGVFTSPAKTLTLSPTQHADESEEEQESFAGESILVSHLLGQPVAGLQSARAQLSPSPPVISNGLLPPTGSQRKLVVPERITRAKARMLHSPIKRSARLASKRRL